jgi:hypothetical protein
VFIAMDRNDDGDFLDAREFITAGNVDSFTVTGMDTNKNYTIRYDTMTPHDMARIDYVAGSYNIGGFNLIQSLATPDQKFDYSTRVTDGDTASYFWSVVIDGTGGNDDQYITMAPSALTTTAPFEDAEFVDESSMFFNPDPHHLFSVTCA